MDTKSFLPPDKLAQLTDRVAMELDLFQKIFHPDNIWDYPIELCIPIELKESNVSGVILRAKKENSIVVNGTNIRKFHTILTRIYILLYFKHHDEDVYKVAVFPQLLRNMGVYAEDRIVKDKIQAEIGKILEEEKLIEEAKRTKSADLKDVAADIVNSKKIEELQGKITQLEKELTETKKNLDNKDKELKERTIEFEALKYEMTEREKANIKFDDLDAEKELGIYERIIFFSSALRLNIEEKGKSQSQLARLIYRMKTDDGEELEKKIENIRTYVNKLAAMKRNKQFTKGVLQAAQNVIVYLTNCCKEKVTDEKAELNDAIADIINDIELVYGVSAPVNNS